jgi:hypothetical protein
MPNREALFCNERSRFLSEIESAGDRKLLMHKHSDSNKDPGPGAEHRRPGREVQTAVASVLNREDCGALLTLQI